MFKKVTALFISILCVLACVAVPAAAEQADITLDWNNYDEAASVLGSYKQLRVTYNTQDYITWNIPEMESGNYEVIFYGGAQISGSEPLTNAEKTKTMPFLVEVGGSTLVSEIPLTGNNAYDYNDNKPGGGNVGWTTMVEKSAGIVALDGSATTLKFTHLGYNMTTRYCTITLRKVGAYDPVSVYRYTASFDSYTDAKLTKTDGLARVNDWLSWDIDLAYDGNYEVFFLGGAETGYLTGMNFTVEITPKDTEDAGSFSGTALCAGANSNGNKQGRLTRTINEIGRLPMQSGAYTITFTDNGPNAATEVSQYNKIYLVRTGAYSAEEAYSFDLKFNEFTTKDTNDSSGVYADDYVEWASITPAYDGNYEVYFTGGAQSSTEWNHMNFTVAVGDQSISGTAPWTGTSSKNYLGNSVSNAGWSTLRRTYVDIVSLRAGETYTVRFTNTAGASTRLSNSYLRFKRKGAIDPAEIYDFTVAKDAAYDKEIGNEAYPTSVYKDQWLKWQIEVAYDGVYDIYFTGGAMSNTEGTGINLKFEIAGNSVEGTGAWTGNDVGAAGWAKKATTKINSVPLKAGSYILKMTNM
ncbi:MAG: hypothetical protein IKL80_05895, partial [Clostridia bacterium]|nr:hypothetical protein [Clostridia bacterium]